METVVGGRIEVNSVSSQETEHVPHCGTVRCLRRGRRDLPMVVAR